MSRKKKFKKTEDVATPEFSELNLEFAEDADEAVDAIETNDAVLQADEAISTDDTDDELEARSATESAEDVVQFNDSAEERDLQDESATEAAAYEMTEDDADSESRGVSAAESNAETNLAADEDSDDNELDAVEDGDAQMLEASDEDAGADALAGTELAGFDSVAIEDVDALAPEQIRSVVESVLFSTDKPLSIAVIKQSFKGTHVRSKEIREALTELEKEYQGGARGFTLTEAGGGFQLRTKADNLKYLRQSVKVKPFRLSGPALEVLSIVAYKQPVTKNQIDEIRGVESGHLLRALMEKSLIAFGERSDLPGKPMYYESTRKFLEIFGLRNLAELPSISEIDQLLPEGIGEPEDKETLSDLTGQLSQEIGSTYSEGEDELIKITDELTQISTSSDFFEQEKQRQRDKRDQERAQDIREAVILGNPVEPKDQRWLERYEAQLLAGQTAASEVDFVTEESPAADQADADASGEDALTAAGQVPEEAGREPEPSV